MCQMYGVASQLLRQRILDADPLTGHGDVADAVAAGDRAPPQC